MLPDVRLLTALQNQTARLEESISGDLELYYYRFVSVCIISTRLPTRQDLWDRLKNIPFSAARSHDSKV